jgi:hypothetical protein
MVRSLIHPAATIDLMLNNLFIRAVFVCTEFIQTALAS